MDHTSTPDSSRCCIWLSRRPCRAFSKAPFVVHWIRDPTRHTSKGTYRHGMRLRHKHAVQARETSAGNTTSSWAHTHLWLAVWCSVIWVALSSSVICLAICSIVTCTEHHLMHRAPSHAQSTISCTEHHLMHRAPSHAQSTISCTEHHLMHTSVMPTWHRQSITSCAPLTHTVKAPPTSHVTHESCDTWQCVSSHTLQTWGHLFITHSTKVRACIDDTLYKGEGMYWGYDACMYWGYGPSPCG